MSYAFFTFQDSSGEKSNVTFPMIDLTAANFDAQGLLVTGMLAALPDITKGAIFEVTQVSSRNRLDNAIPVDGQRELKWTITYQDDVTKKLYVLEVPCADDAIGLRLAGKDDANLAAAGWADFIASFNSLVKVDGHACSILRARIAGRNL